MSMMDPGLKLPLLVMAKTVCALLGSGGVGGLGITTGRKVSPQADQRRIRDNTPESASVRSTVVGTRVQRVGMLGFGRIFYCKWQERRALGRDVVGSFQSKKYSRSSGGPSAKCQVPTAVSSQALLRPVLRAGAASRAEVAAAAGF